MRSGDVISVLERCTRYWTETGVPRRDVAEMRMQLDQHLQEALGDGHPVETVIGNDLAKFAETWAAEYRPTGPNSADWEAVMSGRTARQRTTRREMLAFGVGLAAVIAAAGLTLKGDGTMENEIWRWLWTGFAVVMSIGEILTAGFFLLPFAIGAAAAAVLAWVGASILAQWLVFFGVSLAALAYLRKFIDRQDAEVQPRVGANRWVGSTGIVLEEIDPDVASGMVRVDNEQWRATSLHGLTIPTGVRITVRDVQGARLVVEPIEN